MELFVHIVMMVRSDDFRFICYTENDEPAIYADAAGAEFRAGQLRDQHPENDYFTVSAKVQP